MKNAEERVFGEEFKIRLYYEDCPSLDYAHRYFVECLDMRYYVKIVIDSNVIDKTSSITMEDAIEKTKAYLSKRFDDRVLWENFIRP
jgi:hypothetical protein